MKKYLLIPIIFLGIFLRVYMSQDNYLHTWDEKFHALVAKNVIEHPLKPTLYENPIMGYELKNWTGNHVWLHKPPFTLWSIAGSLKIFGFNAFAVRIPSILLSILCVFLCFKIGQNLYSIEVGLFAAFLFSINGFLLDICSGRSATDHVDMHFLSMTLLTMYFIVQFHKEENRRYLLLGGLVLGVAILTKWLTALFVVPILLYISLKKRTFKKPVKIAIDTLYLLLPAAAIAAPWFIYAYLNYPAEYVWESNYNFRHLFEVIEDHDHPIYYFIDRIRILYGEYIYLPIIWLIYQLFIKSKNKNTLDPCPSFRSGFVIFLWIFIPLIVFTLARTKLPGYTAIFAPALFIITADLFFKLKEWAVESKWKYVHYLIMASMIILPVRYCIERLKPLQEKAAQIEYPEYQSNQVIFNDPNYIETMFFTNCAASYPYLPDENEKAHVVRNGYEVVEK